MRGETGKHHSGGILSVFRHRKAQTEVSDAPNKMWKLIGTIALILVVFVLVVIAIRRIFGTVLK